MLNAPVADMNLPYPNLVLPLIFGPNITGKQYGHNRPFGDIHSGALYPSSQISNYCTASATANNGFAYINIDASLSSSVYSDSVTTVQPPANQALIIIRA